MKYDEKRRKEAKKMWAEGASLKQMSEELHVTYPSICSYVTKHREDFPMRNAPKHNLMTIKNLLAVKRMWADGASLKDIVRETGLPDSYLTQYMAHHREDFPRRHKVVSRDPEKVARIRKSYYGPEQPSMREVAREVGCSASAVRNVINGERRKP